MKRILSGRTLAMLAAMTINHQEPLHRAPPLLRPEPEREKTPRDLERLRAAQEKREHRAEKRRKNTQA